MISEMMVREGWCYVNPIWNSSVARDPATRCQGYVNPVSYTHSVGWRHVNYRARGGVRCQTLLSNTSIKDRRTINQISIFRVVSSDTNYCVLDLLYSIPTPARYHPAIPQSMPTRAERNHQFIHNLSWAFLCYPIPSCYPTVLILLLPSTTLLQPLYPLPLSTAYLSTTTYAWHLRYTTPTFYYPTLL